MLFFCALFGKKEAETYKIQVKSQENFSQEQEEPAQGEAVQQAVPQEKPHRSAAEYVLRYLTLVVGLFIMSVGVALSFAFLHRLQGVREGTVAAAVFVGLIARGFNRFLVPLGNKLYAICRK